MSFSTLLTITPLSGQDSFYLTPYSARGLTQTLEWRDQPTNVEIDINGVAQDLTFPQFRKWKSTITCRDVETPAIDAAFIGQAVTVDCAIELAYLTSVGTPNRPPVSGSERTEGSFTYYRPVLTMRIKSIRNSFDEWQAYNGWTAELVEI